MVTNMANIHSQLVFHSETVVRQQSCFGGPHCVSGGLTQFIQVVQSSVDKGQVDVAVHRGNGLNDGEVGFH